MLSVIRGRRGSVLGGLCPSLCQGGTVLPRRKRGSFVLGRGVTSEGGFGPTFKRVHATPESRRCGINRAGNGKNKCRCGSFPFPSSFRSLAFLSFPALFAPSWICNFWFSKYVIFTCESSYCFQRVLAIAILSVCPSVWLSHGWIRQKRSKLGSPNFHHRLPGRL